ncbi:MAG: nickel-responsive transcriptional regulator NikR [Candidatus Aminicenantes bacterium]|nr:nickel-responsive transcriptional regulator NikR [Candidatus Aminicenantes bacterium]
MSRVSRFGVSLEKELLKRFDAYIKKLGFKNRSEAIRNLIRHRLVEEEWKEEKKESVGIVGLVYDHHRRELQEKLTDIQHEHLSIIIASMHVHLDEHNCLEVIVLKGKVDLIKKTADQLLATRNVKYGKLIMATTGANLV